jgi:hypothetical protein
MIFSPSFTGELTLRARPDQFLSALRQRVERGLLTGQPHPRSRYTVTGFAGDRLAFRAADWLTAFNLGLNEVEVVLDPSGRLRYRVEYWRWARYALGLSAGIGAILCVVLLSIDLPRYIEAHRSQTFSGLSVGENIALAWGMALFWGLVWPWILIALHKPMVRRLFERIVAEVDAAPVSGR